MKYFSDLNAGWAKLIINSFYYEPSYIINVPMNILDAWEEYQDNGISMINLFDERDEIYLIILREKAFVFYPYKENGKIIDLEISGFELLKGLVSDIVENIELWGDWVCVSKKGVNKNINALQKRAENLGLV